MKKLSKMDGVVLNIILAFPVGYCWGYFGILTLLASAASMTVVIFPTPGIRRAVIAVFPKTHAAWRALSPMARYGHIASMAISTVVASVVTTTPWWLEVQVAMMTITVIALMSMIGEGNKPLQSKEEMVKFYKEQSK